MKRVFLSRGMCALVDDEDFERVAQYRWFALPRKKTAYAQANIQIDGKRTSVLLHRFILGVTDPVILVDHRDRDGLNCQKANMRLATRQQNAANSTGCDIEKTAAFKGVSLNSRLGRWVSQIKINGVQTYLGLHDSAEEAAKAYDKAAIEIFGEFAFLNFPQVLGQLPGQEPGPLNEENLLS